MRVFFHILYLPSPTIPSPLQSIQPGYPAAKLNLWRLWRSFTPFSSKRFTVFRQFLQVKMLSIRRTAILYGRRSRVASLRACFSQLHHLIERKPVLLWSARYAIKPKHRLLFSVFLWFK